MKKATTFVVVLFSILLLGGCAKEEEYKAEGPKASENPSVGAPVSAGGAPGTAVLDGAPAPGSKGAPPAPGDRGR